MQFFITMKMNHFLQIHSIPILKKILGRLDGVMCISKFALWQLKSLGIEPKKCDVVYGGVNHEIFKPTDYKPHSFDFILSIGSEEPRKIWKIH